MTIADKINDLLENGKKVTVYAGRRIMPVTPSTAKAWVEAGHPMFKMEGETLCMIAGQRKGNPRYDGLILSQTRITHT